MILKLSWSFKDLRQEGMRMESAARSGAQISGENAVNKVGKYSYNKMKASNQAPDKKKQSITTCYNCGLKVSGSIVKHKQTCSAKSHKCQKCQKSGHFESVCRSKSVQQVEIKKEESTMQEEDLYNINIFRIRSSKDTPKPTLKSTKNDFSIRVMINNNLDRVIADTGRGTY